MGVLLSLLSACGYHLRGSQESTLVGTPVALVSKQPNGEFEKILQKKLKSAGVQLLVSGKKVSRKEVFSSGISGQSPQFSLEITELDIRFQGVSRDRSGRANEQIVSARLSYLWLPLLGKENGEASSDSLREIIEPQILTVSANYVQDYRNPIGEETQKKETRRLLFEKLSQQLVRRLSSLTRQDKP